ncbi:ABC transporter ATP-binding protein [Bradyrhizobium erythrophlei]|uniref:ABC transporter ATP-binding protein n=1 Tax=Bradyrhizobium erythrophlei TaxID=1437360 RepID=UPI0035F07893
MSALVTRDLKVHFGGVKALDGVSLTLRQGGVHAIIGPNGAGKTSLINAITGVYRATAGSVCLDGTDVTDLPAHKLAGRGVTRTFQNLQIFWTMTALENVVCGFYLQSRHGFWRSLLRTPALVRRSRIIEQEARAILAKVGLGDRETEMAKNLSYGELKRLEIARAIASRPRILFLDEPVAGCTSAEKKALGQVIRAMADATDATIVLVEHDMKLVMSISDRVTVLVRGRVFADGTADAVRNDAGVIEAYLGARKPKQEKSYAAAG